ncbi:winged helix-turn-helix transcriptional regulator [Lentilactobacillus laojiaonis]|uniref:winged helix-turn-helix transcriptional regulator n=1 Tax=Lentilactobacillus laojiaonis TaxID=2883998 RepID=UPI001D0AAA5B|nr:helix-turn-helix domain-containing protein [Lentilactobacillus laojiaonis]UDM32608.1 helix-turn-helix transcriptional regulator [Lentilactobacillus laojiaonis]
MTVKQINEEAEEVDTNLCPRFEKTFEFLGKKWNGLIIDVLLKNETARFKDIAHYVSKCSDRVIVERLKELENEGLVNRKEYEDKPLIEYSLTQRGRELAPAIQEIHAWAEKWYK